MLRIYAEALDRLRVRLNVYLVFQESAAHNGNKSAVVQKLVSPALCHIGNVTSDYVVPNIVHFIWFDNKCDKQMTFINYVSIVSAHLIQKPDTILFHCNRLPTGEWWKRVSKEVKLQSYFNPRRHGEASRDHNSFSVALRDELQN